MARCEQIDTELSVMGHQAACVFAWPAMASLLRWLSIAMTTRFLLIFF